jgi:hypothetical protein
MIQIIKRKISKVAKAIYNIIASFIWEIIVVCALLLAYNNYIGNVKETIKADGIGYYDYLPSIFIHQDFVRTGVTEQQDIELYERINEVGGVYVNFKEYKIDKYPCGTALLISPFFLCTYLQEYIEGYNPDGYEPSFHKTVFHAAILYLFLALVFLKKLLQLYQLQKATIVFSLFTLALGTSVTHYASCDAAFSHVFSLFAITAFLFYTKSYFTTKTRSQFLLAVTFLALIILLRQINILILFFVPFLASSWRNLCDGITAVFKAPKTLFIAIIIGVSIVSIQSILWYLQCGSFIVYSYQNEDFNFASPEIFNILFSYRKGLFIYTPILFISLAGLIKLGLQRKFYMVGTWLFFFAILTYVLSSWWSWFYGCSYGLRTYIDFYAVFFILFAILIDGLVYYLAIPLVIITLGAIKLNIVQTYQYKDYIMDWQDMDKEKYWKIFMHDEQRYKGLLWKKKYDFSTYQPIDNHHFSANKVEKNTEKIVAKIKAATVNEFSKVTVVGILFTDNFDEKDNSKITLSIEDTVDYKVKYNYTVPLIHFADSSLNSKQKGTYFYDLRECKLQKNDLIYIKIEAKGERNFISNTTINFYKNKK